MIGMQVFLCLPRRSATPTRCGCSRPLPAGSIQEEEEEEEGQTDQQQLPQALPALLLPQALPALLLLLLLLRLPMC